MPAPEYLIVSEDIWRMTATLLEPYATAGVEAGVYWYGIRNAESAVVSVLGIPQQTNRKGNFEVSADHLAILIRRLERPLVAVAQLHTHPGRSTEHSYWDNDLVVSRKILSLVLPAYGRNPRLEEAGVHEFTEGDWRQISSGEAARRIVLTPSLMDTRS